MFRRDNNIEQIYSPVGLENVILSRLVYMFISTSCQKKNQSYGKLAQGMENHFFYAEAINVMITYIKCVQMTKHIQ